MAPLLELIKPTLEHLPSFMAAMDDGWDPPGAPAAAVRAKVHENAIAFLAEADDHEGRAGPITLPDGTILPRLPSITRWIWDGAFAGRISLRWQPGTVALPPTCLGHIGYGVVPWRQGRGYATFALGHILAEARALGLPFVELTTSPENVASQRVIAANGGVLWERFTEPAVYGGRESLRYRIALSRDT